MLKGECLHVYNKDRFSTVGIIQNTRVADLTSIFPQPQTKNLMEINYVVCQITLLILPNDRSAVKG